MPYLFALGAVFFWSFNVLMARTLADILAPVQISFLRWAIAACLLFPFTIRQVWAARDVFKAHWKIFLLRTLTGIVLMNLFIYEAGRTTSVINMALLGTTGPVFLILLSAWVFKTKISEKQVIGLMMTLAGVAVILAKGSLSNLEKFTFVAGDFWILGKSVIYGIYNVTQTKKIENVSQITLLSAMVFTSTLILLPFFLFSLYTDPIVSIAFDPMMMLLYLGTFPSILSFWLWNTAVAKAGPMNIGLFSYITPVLSTFEAVLLLNETLSDIQLMGGVLVLSGVFVAVAHRKNRTIAFQQL